MRKIVALPPDAPVELGDPSNQYYDPQKLAKPLGFKGFSWKAIHCDGAGLAGWLWINGVTEEMRAASRHFTLTADRTIDGVDLPAGAEVTLDDYDRLESAALPSGIAVALDGSTWRGFIKFGHGQETDLSAPTRISVGDPVTDTAFDGVLCRAGQPVAFWVPEVCAPAHSPRIRRHRTTLPTPSVGR